jgi:predicted N-acetyltransferase YhbS
MLALGQELPPEWVLRRAATRQELEAVAACHTANFDEVDAVSIQYSLWQRPGNRPSDCFFIAERATGMVLSSINLQRETWTYEGIPLPVAEAAMVSTRAAYRGRGLVRALFEGYHRLARQEGCVLSLIEGIPYFYRQFGYEYMIPTEGGLTLRPEQVPPPAPVAPPLAVRRATPEDMPALLRLCAEAVRNLAVAAVLPAEVWRYQDDQPPEATDGKITLVVAQGEEVRGYARLMAVEHDFHQGVSVCEASLTGREECLVMLRFLAEMALRERQEHLVHIALPRSFPLYGVAQELGGTPRRPYACLVRVLDAVRLLLTIAPALQARLAASAHAGLTRVVTLNLYTHALALRFRQGRLETVDAVPPPARGGDVSAPSAVMPMLWLGHRSLAELLDIYPDAFCREAEMREIVSILFPKRESWVCTLF